MQTNQQQYLEDKIEIICMHETHTSNASGELKISLINCALLYML